MSNQWTYKDFTQKEMQCRCGCGMLPTPEFMTKLQAFRTGTGIKMSVSSGARCLKRNTQEGGSKDSYHMKGRAADIEIAGTTKVDLFDLAPKYGFNGRGVGKTFLHVDDRPLNERAIWSY